MLWTAKLQVLLLLCTLCSSRMFTIWLRSFSSLVVATIIGRINASTMFHRILHCYFHLGTKNKGFVEKTSLMWSSWVKGWWVKNKVEIRTSPWVCIRWNLLFILGKGADSLCWNYSPHGATKPHQMVASAPKVNVNTAGRWLLEKASLRRLPCIPASDAQHIMISLQSPWYIRRRTFRGSL